MSNEIRDDLKPCPFCGCEAVINHEVEYYGSHCKCSNSNCAASKNYIIFEQWQERKPTQDWAYEELLKRRK